MRTLIPTVCAFLLLSCSSNRYICIDMEDFSGLEENFRYQMIIENPNEPNTADTVYWQGSKRFKYELKEITDDFLAFVEVSKMGDMNDAEQILFRSVAAIDGDNITVKAFKRDSIVLSGSKFNEYITDFWHGRIMDENLIREQNNTNIVHAFCQKEMNNHPNDLYGAFIFSWDCMIQMMNNFSYEKTIMLQTEIKQSHSYISSHSVIRPYLEDIITAGDLSPLLVSDFTSYMCPY